MTGNTQDTNPILVLGGTGKTRRRIVQRLRARNLPVRVGSRAGPPPFDWEDRATWAPALAGDPGRLSHLLPGPRAPRSRGGDPRLRRAASYPGRRGGDRCRPEHVPHERSLGRRGRRTGSERGTDCGPLAGARALALAERALTVPQIARRMGLTRQAVQASVNRLRSAGLVDADENPDHLRSPLIRMTEIGAARYAALDRRQIRWIKRACRGARALGARDQRLDANAPKRRKER
jgi:DNA-binding MarR family transcriptional regulator